MIVVALVQWYGNFEKQCNVRAISNVHNNYGWYLVFLMVQNVLISCFDKGRTEDNSNHHSQDRATVFDWSCPATDGSLDGFRCKRDKKLL